ncbi:MAG: glycoside hydrolase family 78 protein [Terracidiphilus sp.]|jgi:alpha-L-rhamnosidase
MRHSFLLLFASMAAMGALSSHAAINVSGLRCESAVNPLGIDAAKPRLSWLLASSKRGQMQTAYQILAASDENKLQSGQADLWDSGKVASDQSIQVSYKGPVLSSRQRVFWKVRVWDKDGAASPYSEAAFWEMALLSPRDWKAQWIGYDAGWSGRALYFRSNVTISKAVRRARIYVSGLGYYELSLNGSKVGDHVLDPGFTDYAKRVLYATYDVASQLRPGSNTIGVIVGSGWYGIPKLLLQFEVTYADGSEDTFYSHSAFEQTDGAWRVTNGPILADSVYDGETYDARLEKDGWDLPAGDSGLGAAPVDRTSEWLTPHTVTPPGGRLVSQTVNPIKIVDAIRPKAISEPKPGVFVYDFGQNMAGWAQLHVSGERGARVALKFSELLSEDGTVNQNNLRAAAATDVYIFRGGGVESWEPRFTYHGFRYVQIEGFPGQPTLENLTAKVVRSSVEPSGMIQTSNDLINRIQKMVWWTEASNLYSIPTDCPQRDERMGWMNDLTVRSEEAVYNFNMSRFYPKFLHDIRDAQGADGSITDTVPFRWGRRPADPVSSSYLIMGWMLYLHYGDTHAMAELYDGFKAWTDYLRGNTKDNIVTYGYYGDWSPPKDFAIPISTGDGAVSRDTPLEFMSTGYLYYDERLVSRMAKVLGKKDDEVKYENEARQVAAALNKKYWNEAAGGYGSNNQSMNSFALFLGVVPRDREGRVVANLVRDVKEHQNHLTTGNLCTKYLLEMLTKYGYGDLAFKVATQETYPSWGYMIANGATTLWERWEQLAGGGMNSQNHPMMGSVSSWIQKYLGGINPDPQSPGFKRIVIRPYILGDLTWVRAEYESPFGLIRSSWRKENAEFRLKVTVPVNTTATIYVPARNAANVTEGGKPATTADSVKSLGRREGEMVFEIGSGDYEFIAK